MMVQRRATRNLMISCFLIVDSTLPVSFLGIGEFKEDETGDLFLSAWLSGSRPCISTGALLNLALSQFISGGIVSLLAFVRG